MLHGVEARKKKQLAVGTVIVNYMRFSFDAFILWRFFDTTGYTIIGIILFYREYRIDEERNVLRTEAFIGVNGADTVRYDRDTTRWRRDAKNTEVDLGDFAVYTAKYGIGITYQVIKREFCNPFLFVKALFI